MREVKINVYDKQTYNTHSDANESKFEGELIYKNESMFIKYIDKQMAVTTVIKAKGNAVSVKRYGSLKADLYFNMEQPHETIYYTPYGEMNIRIVTNKCDVYLLDKAVKINIEYSILMQDEKISDNIYMIVAN